MNFKQLFKKLLETALVGRPLRKIGWIVLKIFEIQHRTAAYLFWNMPYVKKNSIHRVKVEESQIYRYFRFLKNNVDSLKFQPVISIIVPVYKVKPLYLKEMLQSIASQTYENWQLCIVDDHSNMPKLNEIIEGFAKLFPGKVRFAVNEKNLHISGATNKAIEMATGEYIALLDHDDRLLPNSLGEMVRYINLNDQPDILYSDERVINEKGKNEHSPFFKPGWSKYMHLAVNYTTHLTLYKTELVKKVGGCRVGYEGSQDHDLMLRMTEASNKPVVHVPLPLYQWRAHSESTAGNLEAKPYAAIAGEKAVAEACQRRGQPATVEFNPKTLHYRVKFELPKPLPLVSIVIPSKNQREVVNNCLKSVFEKSSYQNFEIIVVDNGSDDPKCLDLYKHFETSYPNKLRVIYDSSPFNFGSLCNQGAKAANGEYLLLLNNDTEVISNSWIEELLSMAAQKDVGAVGAKLLYPDNKIQHGGGVLVSSSICAHIGINLADEDPMYCDALNTTREVSAVTAACLMISKAKFLAVGGLDQVNVPNGFGDVDFCLKLMEKGWANIYTPHAKLYHFESRSRKASLEEYEKQYMIRKWGHLLIADPYLNLNLEYLPHYAVRPEKLCMDFKWRELSISEMPISERAKQAFSQLEGYV